MSPYPQPLPGSPSTNRKKETVKFSTLDHPPRANLLPPAALLSLLCLAFLCLLFVCFRHTEWIVKARRKIWKLLHDQAIKLSDQFEEFKYNRQRRIKLLEEEDEIDPTGGPGHGSRQASDVDRLQSLSLSHHHRELGARLLTVPDPDDEDEEEDEDNEVLPQVLYSK